MKIFATVVVGVRMPELSAGDPKLANYPVGTKFEVRDKRPVKSEVAIFLYSLDGHHCYVVSEEVFNKCFKLSI